MRDRIKHTHAVKNNPTKNRETAILSIQIIARANQKGVQITTKQLFQYQTIAQLATVASHTNAVVVAQGLVIGEVPLTPIQKWFFVEDW